VRIWIAKIPDRRERPWRSIVLYEVTEREAGLLVMLFPQLAGLDIRHVEDLGEDGVRITVRTRTAFAACRRCGEVSARGHDRYLRRLSDLGCGGRPAETVVLVRRFSCQNPACEAATFAEQVPGLTAWYQRRTAGLRAWLERTALALAGRAGARLAAGSGAAVSRHTLIRLVRALPDPQPGQVSVLGVDDIATRRGHAYATVLVDMDSHQVIDMLPDREADTLADWLRAHPGIAVICRDRASAYARAAREAAPAAVQVADRWHLWHNLTEAIGKTVLACLPGMTPPPGPASGDDTRDAASPGPAPAGNGKEQPLVTRHRERYAAVQALRAGGCSIAETARRLHLDPRTAARFAGAAGIGELLAATTGRRSVLDPYKPYLSQRWNDGITSATALDREIRARGWTGSTSTVRNYLRQFRTADGRDRQAQAQPQLTAPPPPPRPRTLTRWLMTRPGSLPPHDAAALTAILAGSPQLRAAAALIRSFADMITGLRGQYLDAWITAVRASPLPALHSFATSIEKDRDAVLNGLTLPCSSGPVEGNNCKIKHIKRLMYGRASFSLLRKMTLLN
jgi:transposase